MTVGTTSRAASTVRLSSPIEILENMLSLGSKAYQACHRNYSLKKWVAIVESKKRKRKFYHKLAEKTPQEFSENLEYSPAVVDFIKENLEFYTKHIKGVKAV